MGLVQASCNPFNEDRALRGVNLGEVAQEVLGEYEEVMTSYIVPLSTIKRVNEGKVQENSIGFRMTDLLAFYGDNVESLPTVEN